MATSWQPDSPAVAAGIYRLYRDFFDRAEKRRRWSLRDDIPWEQCNRSGDLAVADVVESFCAVELFLPDYLGKIFPHTRTSRGRAWFTAAWGYEESKHSLALGDWLLRSGMRSDEQMADLESWVVTHEFHLPLDSVRGMMCYSMTQELSTYVNYRNLRRLVGPAGDPALFRLLGLIAIDERAHFDFFCKAVRLYLEDDRPGTLEQLGRVLNHFDMPALYLLADSRRRAAAIRALAIFDERIYFQDVYVPILAALGVDRSELRRRTNREVAARPPLP
jgi:acyl-[acyl-carrier-protein] desaturase